jgi:formylglycine-generating enzyme required for sulfatase activity
MTKNFAITIGINKYEHIHRPLNYAASDAEKVRDFLLSEADFDQVFYYSDYSPSINNISTRPTRSGLLRLLKVTFEKEFMGAGDNFWFFFSGHGARVKGIDYIIPSDAFIEDIESSAISVNYIIQRLQRCGADNVVLILDACREQGDNISKDIKGVGEQTEKEAREKGVITICSCSPNEYSWELKDLQQGVFTYALLEGLGSKGRKATVERLNEHLKYRVKELAKSQGKQTPSIMADPIEKSHLILMPKYATKSDISMLKNYCYQAQVDENFELAESLWIRVLETGVDRDAIKALQKIAIQKQKIEVSPYREDKNFESKDTNAKKHVSIEESEKGKLFTFEVVKVNSSGSIVNRREESARQKIEDLGDGIELEMVYIPGGTFMMGSPENEEVRSDREGPQHNVTVSPFFMGKYPVTQGQWRAIASQTNLKVKLDLHPEISRFNESYQYIYRWQRPVELVNWFEAVEFCKRLSKLTGRNYRLPSEAEWEYACRAGTTTPFHFGETINTELANYRGTDNKKHNWSGSYGDGPKGEYREQRTPVGQFPANAFGLYDMHGNVWEWCADEWHDNYAGAPTDGSVWLNEDKDKSPLRGGSWANLPSDCRSAFRFIYNRLGVDIIGTGFRVVCDGGRTL